MPFGPVMLGTLSLPQGLLLSPMEGVSCVGYRRLCHQAGAALTYTEMIRARGVAKRNKSTLDLIDTHDPETPTGLQLMTTGPGELEQALMVIDELARTTHPHWMNIITVDLNFGCPSPEVIRVGAGPAMLKRRSRLAQIFHMLHTWRLQTPLPIKAISCKIRLGLNAQEAAHKTFLPVVELASEELDFITVHGRHAGQRSRDVPSWDAIGEAKRVAKIPVIGNGDVVSRADALRLRALSGVDGVMVARAAIRDPWACGALIDQPMVVDVARVDAAVDEYRAWATRCATKDKFRQFHDENFARLRLRAAGQKVDMIIPQTLHLS
jgi:tRNA-dihydrouridine synthase B